ncbi:MAG: hypothetical protein QXL34_01905 [Thermosphaera sp.]
MQEEMNKLKSEIINLIDDSTIPVVKEAFYSNQEVENIMERLYKEWEKNGNKGIPLDYATHEELIILHRIAKQVVDSPYEELSRTYIRKAMGLNEAGKEKRRFWRRLFKKD